MELTPLPIVLVRLSLLCLRLISRLLSFLPKKLTSPRPSPSSSPSPTHENPAASSFTSTVAAKPASSAPSMDPSELKLVFHMFDRDGDGRISREELGDSLRDLGINVPEAELASMIERIDANGDGYVDSDEFATLYRSIMEEPDEEEEEEEEMREAFNVFDRNRDGFITVEELRSVLASLGLEQGRTAEDCKKMIVTMDADGDGMVDFKEFRHMMNRRRRVPAMSDLSYGSVNLVLSEDRSPVVTLGPFHARWVARSLSHGSVNLVLDDGKPRFETHEIEQPKKGKYLTKKRLKLQRKRERQKRREANKTDPRRIRPKGKKNKARFPSAEDRIKHKIEKALEKSKYEQSLDTVRRFIAISEKELELYYRHVALYGDPNSRNADLVYGDGKQGPHVRISEMPRSTENIKVNSTSHDASASLFDEENFSSTGDDDTSDDNSDDDICSSTSDEMSEDICDEESVCLSHDTSSTSLSEAESDSEVNSEDEVNSSVSLSEAESDSDDAQLMAVEIDSEGEPVLDYEVNSEDEVNSSVSLSDAESDSDDGQFMAVEIDSEGEPVLDSEVNSEDEVNSSASLSEAESDSDDGQLMAVEIDSELDSEVDSEDEVSSSVSLSEAESDSDDGQLMAVEIDSEREPVLDSEVHSKDEENTVSTCIPILRYLFLNAAVKLYPHTAT
ncbi:hypothetical protein B296_00026030 [Ensete ventricosum]|uniref:EF-hand domain-containing protein n=1 Tax=Ensete ventricosum TaxID=4639 RepID=A0A427ARF0_ENSVE|nr:hypothetical protein B296_00026030 [Ensete ventricosum]